MFYFIVCFTKICIYFLLIRHIILSHSESWGAAAFHKLLYYNRLSDLFSLWFISENPSQSIDDIADDYSISSTDTNREKGKLYMPYKDILEFKEMNPPDLMPKVVMHLVLCMKYQIFCTTRDLSPSSFQRVVKYINMYITREFFDKLPDKPLSPRFKVWNCLLSIITHLKRWANIRPCELFPMFLSNSVFVWI